MTSTSSTCTDCASTDWATCPPQHTTYYAEWKEAHARVKTATGSDTKDNLYRLSSRPCTASNRSALES